MVGRVAVTKALVSLYRDVDGQQVQCQEELATVVPLIIPSHAVMDNARIKRRRQRSTNMIIQPKLFPDFLFFSSKHIYECLILQ